MIKKFKKIICICLAVVITTATLCSCGSNSSNQQIPTYSGTEPITDYTQLLGVPYEYGKQMLMLDDSDIDSTKADKGIHLIKSPKTLYGQSMEFYIMSNPQDNDNIVSYMYHMELKDNFENAFNTMVTVYNGLKDDYGDGSESNLKDVNRLKDYAEQPYSENTDKEQGTYAELFDHKKGSVADFEFYINDENDCQLFIIYKSF